jgi:subtilisin family serine protease
MLAICLLAAWLPFAAAGTVASTAGTGEDADIATASDRQLLLMLRAPPPHFRPEANYGGGYPAAPGREARRRLARALARTHGLRVLDDWPMPALGLDCFVLEASSGDARARLLPQLAADRRVESVQPMQAFHVLADGDPAGGGDPLAATQPAVADWHLRDLHAIATGRNVVVAALDTGIDAAHPDLRGQALLTRNFIDGTAYAAEAHGTAVAGIIAARTGDGIGIAGIAPRARLLALRACAQPERGGDPVCSSFSLAKALQFALESRARVFNLSLTGPSDRLLGRLLDVARQRGAVVVAAIDLQAADDGFPANHPGVLGVAGIQSPRPLPPGTLRAPERGIPAPEPGGGWDLVSGTSFAAAQVSGLVALLVELSPRADAAQLRAALSPPASATATANAAPGTGSLGAARIRLGWATKRPQSIDACAAVARMAHRCACDCAVARLMGSMPRH